MAPLVQDAVVQGGGGLRELRLLQVPAAAVGGRMQPGHRRRLPPAGGDVLHPGHGCMAAALRGGRLAAAEHAEPDNEPRALGVANLPCAAHRQPPAPSPEAVGPEPPRAGGGGERGAAGERAGPHVARCAGARGVAPGPAAGRVSHRRLGPHGRAHRRRRRPLGGAGVPAAPPPGPRQGRRRGVPAAPPAARQGPREVHRDAAALRGGGRRGQVPCHVGRGAVRADGGVDGPRCVPACRPHRCP
mmetsp:Transcript_21861/g.61930  ORF Transcript_21861/g.61930 Transcript_21861/m.61930 type:complete len:244 (+) Transcript_21861:832-1563(+)